MIEACVFSPNHFRFTQDRATHHQLSCMNLSVKHLLTASVVCLLFLGLAAGDALAQVQRPPVREYLFTDTLETDEESEDILTDEEDGPGDSLQIAASEALDSLSALPNYVPKVPMELLKDRLSCIERTMPLTLNTKVASFIDYFVVRNRNYTQTMLERKDYYFPLFEKKLKEHGLPDELKYLAIVESGLNHAAVSKSGAVGLWQFMSFTGKDMKLRQDFYFDERLAPEQATEAACKYLKMLYRVFGDWELVLAAYNCGLGKILRVKKATGKQHFWDMYYSLPEETRAYVPQFVAVTYAMHYAKEHNIYPDADSLLVRFPTDTVMVEHCLPFDKLAKAIQVKPADLKLINPALRRQATPHNESYKLVVPRSSKPLYLARRQFINDSVAMPFEMAEAQYKNPDYNRRRTLASKQSSSDQGKITHQVKSGETLAAIAAMYHSSPSRLKRWNKLRSGKVRKGQSLIVYQSKAIQTAPTTQIPALAQKSNMLKSEPIAYYSSSKMSPAYAMLDTTGTDLTTASSPRDKQVEIKNKPPKNSQSLSSQVYEVQQGDTLWAITRKFQGLTVEKLMELNGLKERKITPGQKLIVG